MPSRLILALASAALLVISFPNFNQPYCAWVAFVPWLTALRGMTPRQAFGWSYLVGLVFFLGSIWWLVHLTPFGGAAAVLGWLLLCAYLALFFACFGCVASRLLTTYYSLLTVPSAWVALEYLRSHLLTGFGWNLLGYSQAPALSAIQVADLTGVWGVSFLLVLMNAAIADWIADSRARRHRIGVAVAVLGVAASWAYGDYRLKQPVKGTPVRIAVVQGNIPQEAKWDAQFQESIIEQYARLTRQAQTQQPDLILWPETSVPGVLGLQETVTARIGEVARATRAPLVVGAPMGVVRDGVWRLTNSAALVERDGTIATRYNKLHLVPFGEFVPFESAAPWLRDILPTIGSFIPGTDYTVFTVPSRLRFSVLICFEDLFPDLARRFVRGGARLLATITNDAWFGPTAAAYQHAQASTFRAVELRVPMVRAANTGWSGCIDACGRWLASVRDARGEELFVEGVAVCEVTAGEAVTLYRRWGDWFAWLCLLGCLWWAIFAIIPPPASFANGEHRPDGPIAAYGGEAGGGIMKH